jgi:N6-adenosine-specific RNA methylase IME4
MPRGGGRRGRGSFGHDEDDFEAAADDDDDDDDDGGRSPFAAGGRTVRGSRSRPLPGAEYYVGYVEDDETVEAIMKKFQRLEEIQATAATAASAAAAAAVDSGAEMAAPIGEAAPAAVARAPAIVAPASQPRSRARGAASLFPSLFADAYDDESLPMAPSPRTALAPAVPAPPCATDAPEQESADSGMMLSADQLREIFRETSSFSVRAAVEDRPDDPPMYADAEFGSDAEQDLLLASRLTASVKAARQSLLEPDLRRSRQRTRLLRIHQQHLERKIRSEMRLANRRRSMSALPPVSAHARPAASVVREPRVRQVAAVADAPCAPQSRRTRKRKRAVKADGENAEDAGLAAGDASAPPQQEQPQRLARISSAARKAARRAQLLQEREAKRERRRLKIEERKEQARQAREQARELRRARLVQKRRDMRSQILVRPSAPSTVVRRLFVASSVGLSNRQQSFAVKRRVRAVDPTAIEYVKIPASVTRSWAIPLHPYQPPSMDDAPAVLGLRTMVTRDVLAVDLEQLGEFEGVLMDPPWHLEHGDGDPARPDTIVPTDLLRLNFSDHVIPRGLLFIWIDKSLIADLFDVMAQLGFFYVENLVLVRHGIDGNLHCSSYRYTRRAKESLMIFRRACTDPKHGHLELRHQRNPDVVSHLIRSPRSEKPDFVYHVIETLLPNAAYDAKTGRGRLLDLWAQPCNRRPGWTTVVTVSESIDSAATAAAAAVQ